ncbi:hypothetical protein FTUN_8957 [Frigoriglobus tundricola]|uniref:Uncharacterized protein n=1 Tax=Frigoriglobus tundricola TaxID=2774151 RepID=A0A6M5Z7U6_9BACT|nr:hypothetical protein FTUN_8957 [Frigoriglobus tundricola]
MGGATVRPPPLRIGKREPVRSVIYAPVSSLRVWAPSHDPQGLPAATPVRPDRAPGAIPPVPSRPLRRTAAARLG